MSSAPDMDDSRISRTFTRRKAVVTLLVVAGCFALLSAVPWLTADTTSVLGDYREISASGRDAATILIGLVLVCAAGAVACLLAGMWARRAVLVITAAMAIAVAWNSLSVIRQPIELARSVITEATGVPNAEQFNLTIWPYVSLVISLVIAAYLILGVAHTVKDPVKSTKYERLQDSVSDLSRSHTTYTSHEQWAAFDQGEDPTAP